MAASAASDPDLSRISVVIPVYERPEELARCLSALRGEAGEPAAEIIVVDDCSPRSSRELERICAEQGVRYHRRGTNLGPGPARNRGAAMASGEILLFIDADCVAPPGWPAALTRPIREGRSRAATSCYAGPARSGWLPEFQDDDFRYRMPSEERPVSFVNGCNLAVDRDLFAGVGGFPDQRVSEDMVLGWRLAHTGAPARFLPEAGVLHDYQRRLLPYLRQRFAFAYSTLLTRWRHRTSRLRPGGPSSFRAGRTVWCAACGMLAIPALAGAAVAAAAGLPSARWLGLAGATALLVEGLGHGGFLLEVMRRRGLRRALSYAPLLVLVDLTYALAVVAAGLRLLIPRTSPSPSSA